MSALDQNTRTQREQIYSATPTERTSVGRAATSLAGQQQKRSGAHFDYLVSVQENVPAKISSSSPFDKAAFGRFMRNRPAEIDFDVNDLSVAQSKNLCVARRPSGRPS